MTAQELEGPLDALTILDLSEGIAGPYAAMLFAQQGARVIKVERPASSARPEALEGPPDSARPEALEGRNVPSSDQLTADASPGDAARGWGPFVDNEPGPERSLTFHAVNAAKLSLTLDYETPEGAAVLQRLAEDADAIIEDHPTRRRADLGLAADTLIARIPRLVITQVSAFGASGPYAGRPLTGATLAAAAARLPPDSPSEDASDADAEHVLGLHAFVATLAGLWHAAQTEHGQVIDVAGLESLVATLGGPLVAALNGDALAVIEPAQPQLDLAQLRAEGLVYEVEHPVAGRLLYPVAPFVLASTRAVAGRAPLLGEHTGYVLHDLIGLEAATIESLRAKGIV